MTERLRRLYQQHRAFILLFLLFISFRALAIMLFRPGGFITDFSDYDFYYAWGQLVPMGYHAYDNLWTAYPPLFPAIMLNVFEASSRIPTWIEPRLAFRTLFGFTLLLFESGNLILIYRLGNRLGADSGTPNGQYGTTPIPPGLVSAGIYALLFVPVYTLIGWFEPMPLFFMLLGLDLLLANKAWGWSGSAVAAGLGFLTKLTPILLVPIAVRWLGAKLSWRAFREEWFNRKSPGNLLRATLYVLIFAVVVVGVGYPFVRTNPALAFSSFRIQSIRPPWQSIWAVADGFYGYGLVPLDMRNLVGFNNQLWESSLPWTLIGLVFVALYLWLYTRRYDWSSARTPIAFSGASVLLLFLYSKGWSPQFLLWVLVYIALLMPNLRGICLAILLSLVNFVEADVFLIMLPDEHWIMVGTVLTRTLLLLLLIVEFLGQIWPASERTASVRRWAASASWIIMAAAIVGAIVGTPRAAAAYQTRMLSEYPCAELVAYLDAESEWPTEIVITQQSEVWRDLYPWLRTKYEFHVLDGYSAVDQPANEVVLEKLNDLLAELDTDQFYWIERSDAPENGSSPLDARRQFFERTDVSLITETQYGACTLYRVSLDTEPIASADVAGGAIELLSMDAGDAVVGFELPVRLLWRSTGPIQDDYTVFTQLLDSNGVLVSQQDNMPVNGLAPTSTWQPGAVVCDAYLLPLDDDLAEGPYRLLVGLYNAGGERAVFTQSDGTRQDHVAFDIAVTVP